mgnify:CR=1 FL=1
MGSGSSQGTIKSTRRSRASVAGLVAAPSAHALELRPCPGQDGFGCGTLRVPLDGSEPTFDSRGELSGFAIEFAKVVRVSIGKLGFRARSGRTEHRDRVRAQIVLAAAAQPVAAAPLATYVEARAAEMNGDEARFACDADERAAAGIPKRRNRSPGEQEHGPEVDVHQLVPRARLGAPDGREHVCSRTGDDCLERTRFDCPIDQLLRECLVPQVTCDEDASAPLSELARHAVTPRLVPPAGQHPPTVVRQGDCRRAADPARGAGDDRHLHVAPIVSVVGLKPARAATSSCTTCTWIFVRSARCQAR